MVSRRALLGAGALGVMPAAWAGGAAAARSAQVRGPRAGEPGQQPGPSEALDRLRAGNDSWVEDQARHPDASVPRRHEVAAGQHPFAVVFSCIDSRVPPELVFDQGLGDLFVVRTAAHTLDDLVTGSLEYGPEELATPLLLVLGHQRCGAVTAAVQSIHDGEPLPGHLRDIVEQLRGPYQEVLRCGGGLDGAALVDAVVREQTRQTVAALRADELLAPRVADGTLLVAGGYYSLDTGAVTFSV